MLVGQLMRTAVGGGGELSLKIVYKESFFCF